MTSYISDVFQGAELEGFADGSMDDDFIRQVKGFEGIEEVLPVQVLDDRVHGEGSFILLMAAVGIVNNLLINYMQRRRAIAMYKSAGLSSRQNVKMMLIEGVFAGMIGAAAAIAVSYMEIQTIFIVAGPKISIKPDLDAAIFLAAGPWESWLRLQARLSLY